MTTAQTPSIGELVTVTITDPDGEKREYHGTLTGAMDMYAVSYESAGSMSHNFVPVNTRTRAEYGEPKNYLRVYSATGNQFFPPKHTSEDYLFSMYDFYVAPSKNVKIRKITKAGRVWIEANLSIDKRRDAIVEEAKAMDPVFAEKLDRLLSDVHSNAFDEGKDYEWRNNNW